MPNIITDRLGLTLPDYNESADIVVINNNFADINDKVAILGESNQDINKTKATELKVDTRTTELVYTDGNLTQVLEKDGTTTIKTTTLNYDANGNLTSVVEVADGVSVTSTLNYNLTTGDLESVTKAVV